MRARTTIGESDIAGLLADLLRNASPPIRIETVTISAGVLTFRGKTEIPVPLLKPAPVPFTAVVTPKIADGGIDFEIELGGLMDIVRGPLLDRFEDKISKLPGLRRIGDRIRWEADESFGAEVKVEELSCEGGELEITITGTFKGAADDVME